MDSVRIQYYDDSGGILVQCDYDDDIELLKKLISLSYEGQYSLEKLLDMVGFEYRVLPREEVFTRGVVKGHNLVHVTSEWISKYEVNEIYKCPSCNKGQITYYRDRTPGFKESYWRGKCDKCGFSPED